MLMWEGFCSTVFWTEGLQLFVRKEELEQSIGEHSPGVSLPGNSGLLSTFQDIRCFYHWNGSLDDLKKWCGNWLNASSSLWVLYLFSDRNKDPNYIIAVVNVLEDRDLPFRSLNWELFEVFNILKNISFRVFEVHSVCVFGEWLLKVPIFALCWCVIHVSFRPQDQVFLPGDYVARKGEVATSCLGDHDGTGWMGVMGPMVESSKSWGYRIPMIIMTTKYHFWSGCFKISIQDVTWCLEHFGKFMCSRVQPKVFVDFKATLSSHPTGNGKIVSRATWLWDWTCL